MLVMKFGGSSVASRSQIEKVLAIVRDHLPAQPVVVSSAHKGITNGLVAAARAAASGQPGPYPVVERQREIAADLGCAPDLLAPLLAELEELLHGIRLVRGLGARLLDHVSSFGERMAVRVIADFFTRNGLPAQAHDVWDLGFVTDDHFGQARPLPGFPDRVRTAFATLPEGPVPIVTGFVGKDTEGRITTVGRNGSDLTATLLGAALGAEEIQIWSDTDGIMTADPSVVATARNIPVMHRAEAAELGFFGSRVLHPATLEPADQAGIPVRVRNTNRPDHPGTLIADEMDRERSVTSIAYKEGQTVVTVRTARMFEQAGFLAELFQVMHRHGIIVDVIATSEISVSFTTHTTAGLDRAAEELERAGHDVAVRHGFSILVVVGAMLPSIPGIAARVLQAMADAEVNVQMVSYGFSSISFSMIVRDEDVARAVPVLHAMFFEGEL